jgi:hypothetical protein
VFVLFTIFKGEPLRKLFALSVLSVAFLFIACGGEKEATAPAEEVEAVVEEVVEEEAPAEEAAEGEEEAASGEEEAAE